MDKEEDKKQDIPKPKHMNFPMHKGSNFVKNLINLERIDNILHKQHNKDAKGWLEK